MFSCSQKIFFVLVLLTGLNSVASQTPSTSKSQEEQVQLPYTIQKSSTYFGENRFGFKDRSLYINNGTSESVGFFSNQKFSIFAQKDSSNYSITGFAIASQITADDLQQLRTKNIKMYKLQRFRQTIFLDDAEKEQLKPLQPTNKHQKKIYFTNLTIYGICRTVSVSTVFNDLQIKISYFQQMKQYPIPKQTSLNPNFNPFINSSFTQTIKIPTVVYCIDGLSIKQANFFVLKLYYIVIASFFGLLIHFKPLKKLPFLIRVGALTTYLWASLSSQSLYEALFNTYVSIFLLVIFYRFCEQRGQILPQSHRRQTVLSKSYILVSIASALPLAIKSHLDDENVQPRKVTLYLVNIVMLGNSLLFLTSMVNLKRFKHAFYYFLVILVAQTYLCQQIEHLMAFNLLQLQIFPVPYQTDSLFFAIFLIPLCDFFFKSYSSETIYKFLILLIPMLAKPFHISNSLAFAIGIIFWTINGRLTLQNLVKIVKLRK